MPTLSWVPRIFAHQTVAVTPTVSASAAYTSGDQLGGIMQITPVIRQDSQMGFGFSRLVEVTILDSDKQNAAMDIWFFNQSPTVTSADNDPFAMTAANMKLQCIGMVSVGAAYSAAAAVSVSSTILSSDGKALQIVGTATAPTSVYAIAVVRGTPTYTTTSSVQFQFSFAID